MPHSPETVSHQLDVLEGKRWERWAKEIIEDRWLLLRERPFPHEDFPKGVPIFAPSLLWEGASVEIDLLLSLPTHNTLIAVSCKRSSATPDDNLMRHLSGWKHRKQIYHHLRLEQDNNVRVIRVHLVVSQRKQSDNKIAGSNPYYVFSLSDLLRAFQKEET